MKTGPLGGSRYGHHPYAADDRWGMNLHNRTYAHCARRLAQHRSLPLIDVYQMFVDYDAASNCGYSDLLLDGIHPNDRGHERRDRRFL